MSLHTPGDIVQLTDEAAQDSGDSPEIVSALKNYVGVVLRNGWISWSSRARCCAVGWVDATDLIDRFWNEDHLRFLGRNVYTVLSPKEIPVEDITRICHH